MTTTLQLHTLGSAELRLRTPQVGDVVVPAVQQKHLAVLTYIALSPDRRASRRVLASLLWGDTEDADDRHGLRSSLSLLRNARALGPSALSSGDRESVALTMPLWVDCVEFERYVASGEYEAAIELYKGKFFDGWALPGCEGFEDWAAGRRSHFSALFCAAAREVCTKLTDGGRAPAAVALAERVRNEDPLDTAHWRLLIETRIAATDFVRAAADADRVEQMAAEEGVELDKPMRVLLRRARNRDWGDAASHNADDLGLQSPEMVGREREFGSLIREWERAVAGRFAHAQIVAPPGLGKSRLTRELAARLHSRRARVVVVSCDVVLRGVQFGLVARLARELTRLPGSVSLAPTTASVLVGLEASLGEVFRQATPTFPPADDAVRARSSAIRDLVGAVSEGKPLAILLDDLHWADEASLHVLAAAFAQSESSPVLLVTSARPGLTGGPASSLSVPLRPLTQEGVREMIRSLAGLSDRPWTEAFVEHVYKVSAGSPFLVLQALSSGIDKRLLRIAPEGWECASVAAFAASTSADTIVSARINELAPNERFALLVVGFAAGRLATSRLDTLAHLGRGVAEGLTILERRGLVESSRGVHRVVHDEIFDAAREAASAIQIAEARLSVATAMDEPGLADADRLRQIGMHLLEAGGAKEAADAFRRYVAARRSSGDHRSLNELAREFRGAESAVDVQSLVALLPRSLRAPRVAELVAVLSTAGLVAAVLLFLLTRHSGRSAQLVVYTDEQHTPSASVAALDAASWDTQQRIRVSEFAVESPARGFGKHRPQRPGFAQWAVQFESGDSGGTEVGLLHESGALTRLTESAGEDFPWGWSPDGRTLLIGTSRWSADRHLTIAAYDVDTRTLRRVSHDSTYQSSALWSPDGARVAYVRKGYGTAPSALCWVHADGLARHCVTFVSASRVQLTAWLSPTELLFSADSAGRLGLYRYRLFDNEPSRVGAPEPSRLCVPSADNIWIACGGSVSRLSRLDDWRRLPLQGATVDAVRWRVDGVSGFAIDSVVIASARDTIALGAPFQLAALTYSVNEIAGGYGTVRWASSNTSVAHVDSTGTVTAHQRGRVVITATAGGWRQAHREFVVSAGAPVVVIPAQWDASGVQWIRFGNPLPTIETARFGRALSLNGDSDYFSGAYLLPLLDAARGLGMEATVSTPVFRSQWQYLQFGLAELDSSALSSFTGLGSYLPQVRGTNGCVMTYPEGEGSDGVRRLPGLHELLPTVRGSAYPAIADGRPWRLRVQLLPDGRCGFAVNGLPVWLSPVSGYLLKRASPFTQGHAVGTRILVGDIHYWSGVPSDIDWSKLVPLRAVPGIAP